MQPIYLRIFDKLRLIRQKLTREILNLAHVWLTLWLMEGYVAEQKKYSSVQMFQHRNGRWRAQVKYKDDSGKWHNKSKVLEATGIRAAKHEAEAWRDELERAAQQEVPSADNLGDVGEFADHYIDSLEQSQSVEKSTIQPYRFMQKHIADVLGHVPAKDLNLDAAQEWVNAMAARYAASTVRKALNLLKAAYKDAVRRNILTYRPVDAVRSPKLKKPEPNALDRPQYERLLAYLNVAASTPVNLAMARRPPHRRPGMRDLMGDGSVSSVY